MDNADNFKKQRPSRIAKPFATAYDTKRLAWESGAKQIMVRNVFRPDCCNIAVGVNTEIVMVSVSSFRIYIASKNAFHAEIACRNMKTANTTKEIDKGF